MWQWNGMSFRHYRSYFYLGFARGSPRSVLLAFSQSYIEHDIRKNKIVIPFFAN
jgi:hypothetical protein